MESITFKCEIITPMFLCGADGLNPELRPPSIKGVLRFWWRALNGAKDIFALRKEEADIFGGTDEKIGRSKIVINTTHIVHDGCYKPFMLPHKENQNHRSPQKAFNPDTPQFFLVTLSLSSVMNFFDLHKLRSLFILTCLLGGFGKRARRGFGSVKIAGIKERGETDFKTFDMPMTLNVILEEYINLFSSHYQLDNALSPSAICLNPSASFKPYPYIKGIQIGSKLYNGHDQFLYNIGNQTHDSRVNYPKDLSLGDARGQERFASPVYVSALKENNSKFYRAIITTLNMAEKNSFPVNSAKQNVFKNAIL